LPEPSALNDPMSLIPTTLKAARLARGLSLSALATACGVSAPTLSRLENGNRQSTSDETAAVAAALHMPIAALCRHLVSERLGLSGFYHRKLSRAGSRSVDQIENQCLLDVVALRELFGMVDLPIPESVLTIHLDEARGDAEQAANMLRLKWNIPRGPIQDVCAVVERGGCFIIHSDFGIPDMDAMYQKVRGVPPLFWVNSRKPLDRVRWSISHELGHLVLHEEEPVDNKLAEEQANSFASSFLMPKADFRGDCPMRLGIPELVEMKRRWRCSMAAIARRAWNVGRISEQQYKNIMIEISSRGWRKAEPHPIAAESPHLLASTVKRCLDECQLTEEELADRLAVNADQVRAWQQPFPGQRAFVGADSPFLRLADGF